MVEEIPVPDQPPTAKPGSSRAWSSGVYVLATAAVYQAVHAWTANLFGYGLSMAAAIAVALLMGIVSYAIAQLFVEGFSTKGGAIVPGTLIVLGVLLAAMAPRPTKSSWTLAEKQEIAHFKATLKALEDIANLDNRMDFRAKEAVVNRAMRTAVQEADAVSDKTLAKAHPGLPAAFREKLMTMVKMLQEQKDSGKVDHQKIAQISVLGTAWDKWWIENGKDVRVPGLLD